MWFLYFQSNLPKFSRYAIQFLLLQWINLTHYHLERVNAPYLLGRNGQIGVESILEGYLTLGLEYLRPVGYV